MGNVLLAPNPKYPNCNNSTGSGNTTDTNGMYGMSSYHSGGANTLMGGRFGEVPQGQHLQQRDLGAGVDESG